MLTKRRDDWRRDGGTETRLQLRLSKKLLSGQRPARNALAPWSRLGISASSTTNLHCSSLHSTVAVALRIAYKLLVKTRWQKKAQS